MDGKSDQIYDVIVVGGGTAGCVLASRLSEDPQRKVLLIEAGADALPGREHPDIQDPFIVSMFNPRFVWTNLIAETGIDLGPGKPRLSRHFFQGYGIGGSSNINGMNVQRGQPQDFDEWKDAGLTGWGWADVLPYFKKLEHDLDYSGPCNGDSGPLPIRRIKPDAWAPFAKAMAQAIVDRGYRAIDDSNADYEDGVAPLPISSLPERRISASTGYLSDDVRKRSNLTIRTNTLAERIRVEEGRATGVLVRSGLGSEYLNGREIVVTCGALFTPTLLLRSGIGPAHHLRACGVAVAADLPGVGQNLRNHALLNVVVFLRGESVQPVTQRAIGQNWLRYSSHLPGCHPHDMGVVAFNRSAWHPLGRRIGTPGVGVFKTYSTGSVELVSADPSVRPRIRFNNLDDPRDFDRMVSGLRFLLDLLRDPKVATVRHEAFVPNGRIVGRLARRSKWNWVRSAVIDAVLRIGPLRRALLGKSLIDLDALAADEEALRDYVRQNTTMAHHVSGTCRMGIAGDPGAVVDTRGRVRGVANLRIADPSIFPTIPTGGMHIPVIMAAEKLADDFKADKSPRP